MFCETGSPLCETGSPRVHKENTLAILDGFTANRFDAEKLLGRELDPRLFQLNVLGHRMVVLRDSVAELRESGIYIPNSAAERLQAGMGRGTVLAVGPLCGSTGAPHPTGLLCDLPEDALLLSVIFFQWAGKVLKEGDMDSEFGGDVVVLTDRDIQAIDLSGV